MIGNEYLLSAEAGYKPDPDEVVSVSLFNQYEKVVMDSLIASFGLDFLIQDRYGGDVDTIHNVRQIGIDKNMTYKNEKNAQAYENRGIYDSGKYHSGAAYIQKRREVAAMKTAGSLRDDYTGKKLGADSIAHVDHVISAKNIHNDRGRVLSGIEGEVLANTDENLRVTNAHTNITKSDKTMDEFHEKYGNEYTSSQKIRMKNIEKQSRKTYDHTINMAYYTSAVFGRDLTMNAANVGFRMGLREAVGLVLAEIWFEIKEEFGKINDYFDVKTFFTTLKTSVAKGVENAKKKYKQIINKFKDGALSGIISSIITTLTNIFKATSANIIKIIRCLTLYIIKALKVMFLNPDRLSFEDKMRTVAKILATGGSVVIGTIVTEAVSKTQMGAIPGVGKIVSTFCGTLVSGILACTALYYIDTNEQIRKLIELLKQYQTYSIEYYKEMIKKLDKDISQIFQIDVEKFENEVKKYETVSAKLSGATTQSELNVVLKEVYMDMGIELPWGSGSFDSFMSDENSVLTFK